MISAVGCVDALRWHALTKKFTAFLLFYSSPLFFCVAKNLYSYETVASWDN